VDWIAVDLDYQRRYAAAFPQEQKALKRSLRLLRSSQAQGYAVQQLSDGVVILERNGPINPANQQALDQLLRQAKEG
jgi:hypothetical protein